MINTQNLLCRGKRKDNEEWMEGYYCPKKAYCFDNRTPPLHFIISEFSSTSCVAKEIDVDTLCRNTGIKDKKDHLIWENDIVMELLYGKYKHFYKIVYNAEEGSYMMADKKGPLYGIGNINSSKFEVVGNIFDNPEYGLGLDTEEEIERDE